MRSTTYSALERGVASTAGIDPTNLLAHERVMIAEYVNDATRFCWDYYPWAEFTITEKRYYRPDFSASETYAINDEVYSFGKYWRLYNLDRLDQTKNPHDNLEAWHEVGDYFPDLEWKESALYKVGARVIYKDEVYLCVNELDGQTSTGLQAVNFEFDGITPENTSYFQKIDTTFERYIPYEQKGKDTIGTILSVFTDDPRYNDVAPLNWREGREGIYIEKLEHDQPHVWIKFRKESPLYTADSPDEEVPNFLVPAIKALAYKAWLIGHGQNEKAMLQDLAGLDLLVREVDKLNNQQDRNLPYSIPSEPYRRLNARGATLTTPTRDQIGGVKEGLGELTFKLTGDATGRNVAKKSGASSESKVEVPLVEARQIVKKRDVRTFNPYVITIITGRGNVSKKGSADIKFTLTTGKSHRKIPVGYIYGYKYAFALSEISLDTHNLTGYNAVVKQGGESNFSILDSEVYGRQVKRERNTEINFALESENQYQRDRERNVNFLNVPWVSVDQVDAFQYARKGTLDADISLNFDIVVASWASSASFDDLNISWEKGT